MVLRERAAGFDARWSARLPSTMPVRRRRSGRAASSDIFTSGSRRGRTAQVVVASNPLEITVYQQILAVFHTGGNAMRAKDVCHALGMGVEPKDTEGVRAKLKRLVKRRQLAETEPGLFALVPAENVIRAGQAACSYSWRMPPSRSRRRMASRLSWSGSVMGSGSAACGRALAMP